MTAEFILPIVSFTAATIALIVACVGLWFQMRTARIQRERLAEEQAAWDNAHQAVEAMDRAVMRALSSTNPNTGRPL